MKVGEVFFEVEARVIHDYWARLPLADGESFRFGSEWAAREALNLFHDAGRDVRIVRVTREVVGPG
jgi:hypothetical protein